MINRFRILGCAFESRRGRQTAGNKALQIEALRSAFASGCGPRLGRRLPQSRAPSGSLTDKAMLDLWIDSVVAEPYPGLQPDRKPALPLHGAGEIGYGEALMAEQGASATEKHGVDGH